MATEGTHFTLSTTRNPVDTFAVVDFRLQQSLSELVRLDITVACADSAIGFVNILDELATLAIWQSDIYMSSKPFDDPRLEPGGSGIDYTITTKRGGKETHHMRPGYGGGKWR